MSAAPSKGLVALFKRGWHEIPDIMGSALQGLVGVGIGIYALKMYYDKNGDHRRYREKYTVYRHDDPRVANIRTD